MRRQLWRFGLVGLAGVLVATLLSVGERTQAQESAAWSREAAADYLDGRQAWWMDWPTAARDHGTFCVSCHTATPYALARTALRIDTDPGPVERRLLENVEMRATAWHDVAPFYSDEDYRAGKTSESRGTEAILNALILSNRDALAGKLGDTTRQALDHLWPLQLATGEAAGAWPWLNFRLAPWETADAQYYGAALAAVAVGRAPGGYAAAPAVRTGVERLTAYLRRGADHQPLFNRMTALWASAGLPGALDPSQQQAIIADAWSQQQPDGGWSLSSLGTFERRDGTALKTASDGYATGLVTLALQGGGVTRDDARLTEALAWLAQHQEQDGSWPASSLNRERDPETDDGRFMRDAATAYAVLALTASE